MHLKRGLNEIPPPSPDSQKTPKKPQKPCKQKKKKNQRKNLACKPSEIRRIVGVLTKNEYLLET